MLQVRKYLPLLRVILLLLNQSGIQQAFQLTGSTSTGSAAGTACRVHLRLLWCCAVHRHGCHLSCSVLHPASPLRPHPSRPSSVLLGASHDPPSAAERQSSPHSVHTAMSCSASYRRPRRSIPSPAPICSISLLIPAARLPDLRQSGSEIQTAFRSRSHTLSV